MRIHFTDLRVRKLKPGSYADASTPGFILRVGRSAKTWTVMRGLQRERITIGRYPDISLSDARAEAKKLLSQTPEPKVAIVSFESAKEQFLDEHYRDFSIRTKKESGRVLARHFSDLDKKNIAILDDGDIKTCLDRLKKTPSEQLHAYRVVRCFLKWATRPPRRYIRQATVFGRARIGPPNCVRASP